MHTTTAADIVGSLMSNQQPTNAYAQQHQWQTAASAATAGTHSIMTNQTYQSNYPLSNSTNQQMVMMQHHHPATIQQANEIQQMNNAGNNYIGPTSSSPHAVSINSTENGSTSDDSDDNAANDPIVSKNSLHNFLFNAMPCHAHGNENFQLL